MRKTGYGILHLPMFCAAWLACAPTLWAEDGVSAAGTTSPSPAPTAAAVSAPAASASEPDTANLPPVDELESKVRSTLLFGGSSPVSFSGEGRLRISQHDFYNYPAYLSDDQTWTQANWEGNESMLRLAMVVHANRNAVLWSKIGFQNTLPGIYTNGNTAANPNIPTGFSPVQNRHDKSDNPATIHEDMAAGLAIRTVPASFWVRMGNVMWTEASPLTIWKSQPRTFAWDYLPYEIEQPISRYYEYNIAKGEKSGRAAWNKKAFNGIDFRSIDLPLGFETQVMWAAFERYDNFEREFIDFSNDLGLADLSNDVKQVGIGDSYRHMYDARISNNKLIHDMTLGLNVVGFVYKPDITENPAWRKNFLVRDTIYTYAPTAQRFTITQGSGFYKDPFVGSVDLRGSVNDNLSLHVDAAVSYLDTVKSSFTLDSTRDASGRTLLLTHERRWEKHANPVPALYAKVLSKYGVPVQADLAYIPKGFYSPFSFAAPVDGFYPVGSNLVGTGKFIARGEASPYTQNMAGMFLSVSPQVGYGHLRFLYGQHFQVEKAQDVLYFPYRLNGQDFNSVFQSSYNRWGNDPVDFSITNGHYTKRLGDESFHSQSAYNNPVGYAGGGLRSDYLSIYESFVPYENAAQADSNLLQNLPQTVSARSSYVPNHQKYSFNVDLDGAIDIAPMIGYSHELFLSGYMALNGVSSTLKPIALSPKDMMLWGIYLRAEPAIAVTDKLFFLGLLGYENWRSDMSYMGAKDETGALTAIRVPMDYKDWAYGAGFDWDFAARVGFHARAKWMKHEDKFFSANDWATPFYSAEIKMWF